MFRTGNENTLINLNLHLPWQIKRRLNSGKEKKKRTNFTPLVKAQRDTGLFCRHSGPQL